MVTYSRGPALLTLSEAGLLENSGINGPSGERTVHSRNNCSRLISAADGPIDWNYNAINEPGAIPADVNLQRSRATPPSTPTCPIPSPTQMLEGYDDWKNLRYNYFETINFGDGNQRTALLDGEDLDLNEGLNIGLGSIDIDNDGVANFSDNCMFAPNTNQIDMNGNGVGDVCDPSTNFFLADLSVTMSESADPVQVNTQFSYVATILNEGGSAATNVVFTDQLPANVTFVSVTPQGSCTGTVNISCNLGTIASGSTATITINVIPTVTGRLDNYVDANSGTELDPYILNNNSAASTTIIDSALTFTISGTINDELGAPVSGVSVGYDGTQQGSAVTDGSGNYLITVVSGGIYGLTPSKIGYVFTPPGRSVPYVASNQTVNFTATALPYAITGTIVYGNAIGAPNPRFVSNALITGIGSPVVSTITGAPGMTAGQYVLTGFGSGAYTVTPTKTGGVNGGISSFDAGRIALHVAGPPNPQLTGNQLVAADVSGNALVSSFDAGMIAKFVAGPPYTSPGIGSTGTWGFYTVPNILLPITVPTSRTYPSVTSNVIGDDYTGILFGEVSGNWNNTGARPAGRNLGSRGPVRDAAVALPNLISGVGRDVIVPVNVQSVAGENVIAYEFELRYDPAVIQPVAEPVDVSGTISRKVEIVTNSYEPGLLRVVVYGPRAINENGVLLKLRFVAVGRRGSVSPLRFERIMFNEGEPGVSVTNGEVRIEN